MLERPRGYRQSQARKTLQGPCADRPATGWQMIRLKSEGVRASEIRLQGVGKARVFPVVNERDARCRVRCVTIRKRASIGRATLYWDGFSSSGEANPVRRHEGKMMFTSIRAARFGRGTRSACAGGLRTLDPPDAGVQGLLSA